MGLWSRLLGRGADPREPLRPLYARVVALARAPHWYTDGAVPDTIDGRFDVVALILSIVLLRLEAEGDPGRPPAAHLAELFVDDMDPQLRQLGIGDLVVGKHVGRMMGALGGRLSAYRAAFAGDAPLAQALIRNLWRGEQPDGPALDHVAGAARQLYGRLTATPFDALLSGEVGT